MDITIEYLTRQFNNFMAAVKEKYVHKIDGKSLSSNDFSDEYKNKLINLHNYDDSRITGRVEQTEKLISLISDVVSDLKNKLNEKVDKAKDKTLSECSFTIKEKEKLNNLENFNPSDLITEIVNLKHIIER